MRCFPRDFSDEEIERAFPVLVDHWMRSFDQKIDEMLVLEGMLWDCVTEQRRRERQICSLCFWQRRDCLCDGPFVAADPQVLQQRHQAYLAARDEEGWR